MAAESWVLDGVILTSGTFTLMDLNADPPRARMDWISAADSEAASLFRQPLHENRTITMKLRVTPQASMNTALDKVGVLVDKLRAASATPAGISLVWTPGGSTRACTFTVLAGEITGLPIALSGDGYSWLLSSPIVTVEMTCHPYWLGTETLTSTASSSTPFVTKEVTGVTGDVSALGRLIVTDTATQSRRHVEWGLEGPLTYNASTSLLVDSDDMVTTGFGGTQGTAIAGAYDPNAAGNTSISCNLWPAQTTAVCGTGNLSHVGSFRVKARLHATVGTQVRLSWRSGDGPVIANAWFTVSTATGWNEVDLGTITVAATISGTQRWTGTVEALQASTGFVHVDYLVLVPTTDGYGKARAEYSYQPGVIVGSDTFTGTTATAALNARVAPLGGTWATSGDATDLVFADNFLGSDGIESIQRSTSLSETNGRTAILGSTNYTDVQVEMSAINLAQDAESSLLARWVDSSNYLRLRMPVTAGTSGGTETLYLESVVAGVVTVLAQTTWTRAITIYRLRLVAFASGRAIGTIFPAAGGAVTASVEASTTVLATAGTLATGKPGMRDRATGGAAASRNYDGFAVATPPSEPIALYSGRNMQVRYDDVIRQDSTGTYTGQPPSYRGGRFLLPVGTSRVLVKARRNDIDAADDDQVTDATQIQIGWTPRGLAVPR